MVVPKLVTLVRSSNVYDSSLIIFDGQIYCHSLCISLLYVIAMVIYFVFFIFRLDLKVLISFRLIILQIYSTFRPFASACMVEQTASFLNCFLLHLVGPKRKQLKVRFFIFVP